MPDDLTRLEIATRAMVGILVGMFGERPTAKPPPAKIAQMAFEYADALLEANHAVTVEEESDRA